MATGTITAPGVIEHIDPHTLVLEDNVRPSAPVTPPFVQSIRENGVLTPVLARRDSGGRVLVRAGQRRTLAARDAGLETVPVYVVDADPETSERIIQQMVENDQREALTTVDRVAAFQQLALEGLSIPAIAKRTGTRQKEVKTAVAIAGNATAAAAIADHALTLDQAAVLMEFDDDPSARADLIEVATHEPGQFPHYAQRARDERVRAAAKVAAEVEYVERGYEILFSSWDNGCVEDYRLRDGDGGRVTPEAIETAPGRAVYVQIYAAGEVTARLYVRDPKTAGFATLDGGAERQTGPMTDEQKTARRELIANNKAWGSAEVVRREWLTSLLSRKNLPKDAAAFLATGLTIHRHAVSRALAEGNVLAHQFLGVESDSGLTRERLQDFLAHSPAKATHVVLAIILGAIEASTSKNTWRSPTMVDATYFQRLADWGYALSNVEQIVTALAASGPAEAVDAD